MINNISVIGNILESISKVATAVRNFQECSRKSISIKEEDKLLLEEGLHYLKYCIRMKAVGDLTRYAIQDVLVTYDLLCKVDQHSYIYQTLLSFLHKQVEQLHYLMEKYSPSIEGGVSCSTGSFLP